MADSRQYLVRLAKITRPVLLLLPPPPSSPPPSPPPTHPQDPRAAAVSAARLAHLAVSAPPAEIVDTVMEVGGGGWRKGGGVKVGEGREEVGVVSLISPLPRF